MVRTAGLPLAAQPAAPKTGEPAYHALRSAAGLTLEEGFDQLAEAIRDPTRRRILIESYRDPTPRTASDVALGQGISRAVARTHLEVLRGTGYLRQTIRRGRRGKPAHLYALDTDSPHWLPHPPRQMGLLALLVLEAASLSPERVLGLVEQVGEDYGAAVQDLRSDGRPADVQAAVAPLRSLGLATGLEAHGRGGREARLTICGSLFRVAAPERPDLVCHLYRASCAPCWGTCRSRWGSTRRTRTRPRTPAGSSSPGAGPEGSDADGEDRGPLPRGLARLT